MFPLKPSLHHRVAHLTKKALHKTEDLIDDSVTEMNKELKKYQLGSVRSILEQIKSIGNPKEKKKELVKHAKAHALAFKELEKLRQELETKAPKPTIYYNSLSSKAQKQINKIFDHIITKLNSPSFIKHHHTPEQAKLDRDKIVHDLIQAKRYDVRRFQDLARHYHEKLNLDI
ncbi:hypothetical protein COT94_01925 [Candidatus Falkowbacteria bacterium CG10_big_fil_rev_8_21_14_0_10_37_14]|uniref:Uncharacterized protein n=1 Tax=Candidatus Falkowbacteria bacterium CG10_big_fil_rev_8_21_14_0_10_37_14 TaxID=1974561 RepID=A0A2M6WT91_9BACT|nr:hypothetical protein [Candidatus Falkowbacteria bacterium]PIT96002.1 MAG: hypothetical protein COT94_01925 [Candidatus Falkowbacteria bacterium CG10_big_fil_rev_8_21_14_0_10_37_14]